MNRIAQALVMQLRLFLIALQFFTRIPIPAWVGFRDEWLNRSARYFPLVGLVVGSVTAVVYVAAHALWVTPVAVLLSMVAGILLTGAFHEDGFADVCDGFGGGHTPDRVLEIMKDSRVGAYGVIGAVCMLMLKWQALAALPAHVVPAALLLAHPLSRLASSALIWALPYARANGKAKPLAQSMGLFDLCIGVALLILVVGGLYLAGLFSLARCAASAMVAGLCAWRMGRWFIRRIGGYTGDCLGAVQQVSELAIYLTLLAAAPDGMTLR